MAESEKELKSLLMKMKEESEKVWLKAQHSENEDHGRKNLFFGCAGSLLLGWLFSIAECGSSSLVPMVASLVVEHRL